MTAERAARGLILAAALAALGGACERSDGSVVHVEFGVLFGGDVQDRTTIRLDPTPARRDLALRVTFPRPLARDAVVSWELERPYNMRSPDGGTAYAAEIGERRARAGERRVDAQLRFRRGDPPGTWRIRVRVDGRLALDRSFQVVEPPK